MNGRRKGKVAIDTRRWPGTVGRMLAFSLHMSNWGSSTSDKTLSNHGGLDKSRPLCSKSEAGRLSKYPHTTPSWLRKSDSSFLLLTHDCASSLVLLPTDRCIHLRALLHFMNLLPRQLTGGHIYTFPQPSHRDAHHYTGYMFSSSQ